ncbi:MAG: methyltransferase [Bacteriovorax sp.]|nr:methyltransferase [Bacteriovorax sp.]
MLQIKIGVDSLLILDNKKQMIKNSHYTYDYFQPEEYRFSLDSVFLAQKVAKLIQSEAEITKWKVLDLCAGCGIIGLELSIHVKAQMNIDFLEVQEIYRSFFDKNKEMIYPRAGRDQLRFLNINYQKLLEVEFQNSYDLIVSNPPYFFKDEGLLSPNDFKNRCRFFLDSDFKTLIYAIVFVLKPNSSAYILVRSGVHHGRTPIDEIIKLLGNSGSAKIIDNIRGTDIVEIRKEIR